jgi:glycosyltransferase involved in cell wall biosynthesis
MAQQMRMILEEVPAEWTYVENGAYVSPISFNAGPQVFKTLNGNATIHPGMNTKQRSYCLPMLAELAKNDDYDAMFLHDDPQYAGEAFGFDWKMPIVYWLPYDTNTLLPSLSSVMDRFEKKKWSLVFTANFAKELAKKVGYETEYVYNIVDDKAFCRMPEKGIENFKQQFSKTHGGCPMNRKILLFVGRNSPRKNIDGLIEMARWLSLKRKDFLLVLRTSLNDPSPESPDLFAEIHNRGMDQYVVVDNDDYILPKYQKSYLNMLYNMADLYVSASSGEGFGLPVAEAGMCGKTFVVPAGTTSDEFMGDDINGFASPMSQDAFRRVRLPGGNRMLPLVDTAIMADNVDYLLSQDKKRVEMGEGFRKWMVANCSRKAVATKWSGLLEDLNCGEVLAT